MLADKPIVAFVATARPGDARAFYETTLGLTFVADTPVALIFDANGTSLRIAKMEQVTPAPQTVLGWHVGDITATASALAARGVVFERYPGFDQDASAIWTSPDGSKVAWFKDPDGNLLSLSQSSPE